MANIKKLNYNGKTILLVGTAHVSPESAQQVKEIIMSEKPDTVCIELDEARYEAIKNEKKWSDTDIVEVIKSKKTGYMIVNLLLGNYQRKIAEKFEIQPGQEMRNAISSANKIDAELVLADRNIQTTFRRIWQNHNFFQKLSFIYHIMGEMFDDNDIDEDELSELMEKDVLTAALEDIANKMPRVAEPLIFERDRYLAQKIKTSPGEKVVAIVGAAHMEGIVSEINNEHDLDELNYLKPRSFISKTIGWIIPTIIVAVIALTFTVDSSAGLSQILSWIIWNGSLSALGALIVLGSPLTILTAFIVAPISSLNPLLAAGWFAGLTEAIIRKPKVKDFESLNKDLNTAKGWWTNRLTKVLLVVVFANIGSVIGTMIGGAEVIGTFIESFIK